MPARWSFSRSEVSLSLAFAFLDQEDLDCAEEALAEAIAMCRAAGNTRGVMYAVRYLGWISGCAAASPAAALYRGHLAEAGNTPPRLVRAALAQVLLE